LKAVFLDRDGTVIRHVHHLSKTEQVEVIPNAVEAIKLLTSHHYQVYIITNQSIVARGFATHEQMHEVNKHVQSVLEKDGAKIGGYYACPHHPGPFESKNAYQTECDCRKPKPGLILQAASEHGITLGESWMVGDTESDITAGRRAGCRTILVKSSSIGLEASKHTQADFVAEDLLEAVKNILKT
jgi:D-glycero-D-manno-heptose 1,7-bisphosphate phosphatase